MSIRLLVLLMYETLRVSVPTVVEGLTGSADPMVFDRRLRSWSGRLLEQARVDLDVRGREHVNPNQSYVVMSNHQSHYDIPILFQALPELRLRMIAKRELFRIPIWAAAMRRAGFVAIDRSDRSQARGALKAARDLLAEGVSVWIAPEGTRSRNGRLGEFRPGGFVLALDAAAPILPVAIDGSWQIHAAGSRRIRTGRSVTVTIQPPIDVEAFTRERVPELIARVREAILHGLPSSGATPS